MIVSVAMFTTEGMTRSTAATVASRRTSVSPAQTAFGRRTRDKPAAAAIHERRKTTRRIWAYLDTATVKPRNSGSLFHDGGVERLGKRVTQ